MLTSAQLDNAILFDVESRSRVDLKASGARNYWADESTEILCLVSYDVASGRWLCWTPGDDAPYWANSGRLLVAHNGRFFDRYALDQQGWDSAPMLDSSHMSRRLALPGSLDALARAVDPKFKKDKAASKFTVGLSSARRPTIKTAPRAPGGSVITAPAWKLLGKAAKKRAGVLPELTPEARARVFAYCESDVEILRLAWPMIREAYEEFPEWENEVLHLSDEINELGVCFDVDLATRLLGACRANVAASIDAIAAELGTDSPTVLAIAGSPKQFIQFTGAPDAKKTTIADMLSGVWPCDEAARLLAKARDACASIAAGKLEAGLSKCTDGVLYDTLTYNGAHPGRWAGRGMQLQNLPRPSKEMEDRIKSPADVDALAEEVMGAPARCISPDEIDVLLRATLTAGPGHEFAVGDYSGVESRMLAWLAGDWPELERIAAGVDPYKALAGIIYELPASEITKIQRSAGKIGVLACGYGGGRNALENMAASSGVDFTAAGTTAQDVVDAWREMHPAIVDLWGECERAFKEAYRVGYSEIQLANGRASYQCDANCNITLILPSERPMVYRNVKIRKERGANGQGRLREVIYYSSPAKGGAMVKTYGGKLVENLIQAACRCLMANAMVLAKAAGLMPVLTVHDELVCPVAGERVEWGVETLKSIMGAEGLPEWARGFPVGCEVWHGNRYMK